MYTDCTPGDTTLARFKTEPVRLRASTPARNATGVSRVNPFTLSFNVNLDPTILASITVTDMTTGTPYPAFTSEIVSSKSVRIMWTGGLASLTEYKVTVAVRDTFLQPMPLFDMDNQLVPFELTFTTGA
jgi:hypothetical protein